MVAKRGRPQSDETKKFRREQERVEIELKRTEDMLNNLPSHIKKTPVCQLTQGLANSLEMKSKELLNDYSHRPFTPPDLIFALNDEVVSTEHIEKYKQYFSAPKKGAEAKQKKGWEKTKLLLEHNRNLLDEIQFGRLKVSDVVRIIHNEWFEPSTGDDKGKLKRGIKGIRQKSERQLRRDIDCYLQQHFK